MTNPRHRGPARANRCLRLLPLIGGLAASVAAHAQQAWVPVWADEFNGTALDTTNWTPQLGTGSEFGLVGWGNNELQYYTDRASNLSVGGGLLTITARRENFLGSQYTSARIRSFNKRSWLYGRFEARIRIPGTTGIWPAFWMLPEPNSYGGWAASGEIDIMESTNAADRIYGTIHHGGNWPQNQSVGGSTATAGVDYAQNFHVYAVEWEPDEIRWYLNGQQYFSVSSSTWFSLAPAAAGNDRAPFDRPFHLILNVAVGGNWPGNPDASSVFPQTMQVDWVRVFQRPPRGPLTGTPAAIPGRVEAEDFDLGGGSIAYRDTDGGNIGNVYRTEEAVDIQPCSEGGFNVGWIRAGEWMEYTINVPRAGTYELRARVAAPAAGGGFRVLFNGTDRTGTVSVPATGGWQTWRTLRRNVTLSAGTQVMRFENVAGEFFNLNWFEVLVPGDVNNDGRADIADLYTFNSGGGVNRDVDADGTPGTPTDRTALINLLRATEEAELRP